MSQVGRAIGGVLGLALLALHASAAEPLACRELYRQVVPLCAWVLAGNEGRGTGWIVDAGKKWLITNFHVVGESKSVGRPTCRQP